MNQKVQYTIENGKLQTRSLEIHIVDHCNLRCEGCCSLSPFLPKHFTSPEDVYRDLKIASQHLNPNYLKLVGGEPTLHPKLMECITAAKESQIGKILSITTNGLLLHKMPNDFWQSIDALTISHYPKPALNVERLNIIREKADQYGVILNEKIQNDFVDMTRQSEYKDEIINQSIYKNCWLRERCHRLKDGRFYMCTRPAHFESYFRGQKNFTNDGILLTSDENMAEKIRDYLLRSECLDACRFCKGGHAEVKPHRQLSLCEIRAERKNFS